MHTGNKGRETTKHSANTWADYLRERELMWPAPFDLFTFVTIMGKIKVCETSSLATGKKIKYSAENWRYSKTNLEVRLATLQDEAYKKKKRSAFRDSTLKSR